MPRTPDRSPGALEEDEEIRFITEPGAAPSVAGAMTYDPGVGTFLLQDAIGVFDPRAGAGLTESGHEALDDLVHNLNETHEQIPTFNADGVIIGLVAQGVGGGTVIRDVDLLTADADGLITGVRLRQRNGAGAVVETLTAVATNVSSVPQKSVVTRT